MARRRLDALGRLITILFIFPLYTVGLPWNDPFDWQFTNYTILWFAGIGLVFGGWWALSAKNWFKGPVRMGTEEELERLEEERPASSRCQPKRRSRSSYVDEGRREAPLVISAFERSAERLRLRRPAESLEVLARVRLEVEVELRDGRLHDSPHRFAEVGHEAHELERLRVLARISPNRP